MKTFYLTAMLTLLALGFVILPASVSAQGAREKFTLITPKNGDVLRGGQQVEIKWDLNLEKSFTENQWAEMEFFFETSEGVLMRITPQMSPSARTFMWSVPNINTRTGRLTLQAGLEGLGDMYRFPQSGTFSIKATRDAASIWLNHIPGYVKAGTQQEVTWTSNLRPGSSFDVMGSYNRGAHFHKAGTTTDNSFIIPIEDDFSGFITVQIVHQLGNGTKVRSFITEDATFRVGDRDKR